MATPRTDPRPTPGPSPTDWARHRGCTDRVTRVVRPARQPSSRFHADPLAVQDSDRPCSTRPVANSLFRRVGGKIAGRFVRRRGHRVRRGERVLSVDYEDNPQGIVERLVPFGLTLAEIVARRLPHQPDQRHPGRGPATAVRVGPCRLGRRRHSTGEAMAAGSVDPNSDGEVAQWFTIAKRYARLDGARPSSCSTTCRRTGRPTSYAIGSQRKRAALNGPPTASTR